MSTHRRIYRYEIGIDDTPHEIPAGKVVHFSEYRIKVATGERNRVEVWVETTSTSDSTMAERIGAQAVQVFGTGQPLPDGAEHLASVIDGPWVWHLYRLCCCEYEEIYAAPGRLEGLVRRDRVSTCPNHPEGTR